MGHDESIFGAGGNLAFEFLNGLQKYLKISLTFNPICINYNQEVSLLHILEQAELRVRLTQCYLTYNG